jgi:amino-acid N-acetyltransferase
VTTPNTKLKTQNFVNWFRAAAPYIHAFGGRTFVIAFGGEVVSEGEFYELAHDVNLLNALDVRIVLVHGARPQIETELKQRGATIQYVDGLRVTDATALACVKEAAGSVRVEIEALLSMGLPNSPMAGADIRVASGNFVTAKPLGVRNGVDLQHTGAVRKIDAVAIQRRLDQNEIVLLSPIGYSPTGEVFNLTVEDVATHAAIALKAEKLIFMMDAPGVTDAKGRLLKELTAHNAAKLMKAARGLTPDVAFFLPCAVQACEGGVARAHLISRHVDGAILQELFTRDGIGTMVTPEPVESMRAATIDDVGGVLSLIEPLEEQGVLVRRSRELLEMEIERFFILEHDGITIGCAALYPFPEDKAGELACLAVHPDCRDGGRGAALLEYVEASARKKKLKRLFVLTTQTAHWFVERGFVEENVEALPQQKKTLYNYQRKSKVFVKRI